jgi:hypothetical protein
MTIELYRTRMIVGEAFEGLDCLVDRQFFDRDISRRGRDVRNENRVVS